MKRISPVARDPPPLSTSQGSRAGMMRLCETPVVILIYVGGWRWWNWNACHKIDSLFTKAGN